MTVKSVKLAAPVERIRGGDIIISVTVNVTVDNQEYTLPGIYVHNGDLTNEQVPEATRKAIDSAIALLPTITNVESPMTSKTSGVIKHLLSEKVEAIREMKVKEKGSDIIPKLDKEVDESKQKIISELCEVMGIAPITIQGWTAIEALALHEELKSMSKKFEVQDDEAKGK